MIDSVLSLRARTAVLAALQAIDPVAYFAGVAEKDPPTFCELVGHVLASEVSGSLVLERLIAAGPGRSQ